MEKTNIRDKKYTEERALFHGHDLFLQDCVFENGESPLKESHDIEAENCLFRYKYPFWYSKNIHVKNSTLFENARAGIWYTDHIRMEDTVITAPKNFRRCSDVKLRNVTFTDAKETFWNCKDIEIEDITVNGDYFAMNCENMKVTELRLNGNYGFDGCKNLEVHHSHLLTKDAFWNCENVTVYDSLIAGEYLGWNTKNLTLIGCTIESLQGMCYVDHLVMKDCRCCNTTLAFEYSSCDVELNGRVESVLNPASGKIRCDEIGELIYETDKADPALTEIVCPKIEKHADHVTW